VRKSWKGYKARGEGLQSRRPGKSYPALRPVPTPRYHVSKQRPGNKKPRRSGAEFQAAFSSVLCRVVTRLFLAAEHGVGRVTVERAGAAAEVIDNDAIPELREKVEQDEVSVSAAEDVATLRHCLDGRQPARPAQPESEPLQAAAGTEVPAG